MVDENPPQAPPQPAPQQPAQPIEAPTPPAAPATPIPPPTPEETRTPEPAKPPIVWDTYQATITEMDTHHKNLWEFKFKLDKPMHFIAGQYVSIFLPQMKPAPFSIASSPIHRNTLDLGIEIVGPVTTALSQMQPGDVVTMKGPFGRFVMGNERKVCYLAGGIGITPFMCMLRWIRDTSPDKHAVLFYSCRTQDQFMWLDELAHMHKEHDSIKVVCTLTREQPPDWQWSFGRIDETMIKEELPDYLEYVFYSCGPNQLIDAMFTLLASMGVPKENLRREAWH